MKRLVALMFATLFPLVVNAEVPEWYPQDNFKAEGIVLSIDIKQRIIIIDDQQMLLSRRIKVHSPTQEFVPLIKIKKGQEIGFNFVRDDNGKTVVTEIWTIDETIMPEPLQKGGGSVAGSISDPTNQNAGKDKSGDFKANVTR